MSFRARVCVGVGLLAVLWLCVDGLVIPPDFGQTDIYYFKDAGINFAEGLGLKTRFTYGNPTFEYRDYAHYPPLYPLLFGLYSKAVGISAASNQVFNSLLAVVTGLLGFVSLRPLLPQRGHVHGRLLAELALGAACVVMGYFGFAYDRPDGLAVALGVAALAGAIRGESRTSALAAGVLCALALFTSPFAGIWAASAAALGILARAAPFTQRLMRLLQTGVAAAATVLLALALMRLTLPGWFDGFLGVASGANTHNETGGGYFLALLHGDVRSWWSGFGFTGVPALGSLLRLIAGAGALACVLAVQWRRPGTPGRPWLLMLLLLSPACLLIAPYQANYPTTTAALLLAAWAGVEAIQPGGVRRAAAIALLAAFCVNVVVTVPFEARAWLVRSQARASLNRALAYLQSHRAMLERSDAYSAVAPSSYILWRQAGLHPLIAMYSGFADPERRRSVTWLTRSYPGSGDLRHPQEAQFFPETEYAPIFVPGLPQTLSLFGHRLSNSSQTWETAIYARRPTAP